MTVEVQEVIEGIFEILDSEYGSNRDKYEYDGDYVIVTESIEDFNEIQKKTNMDVNDIIVKYVDNMQLPLGFKNLKCKNF